MTPTRDELLIHDDLIYTLRDGANHTEIRVTMAYGSRNTAARNALAEEIRVLLCAQQAQADQTWNEAIDRAATAASFHGLEPTTDVEREYMHARNDAAEDVQSLARPSQAQEPVELGMSMFASRAEYEAARMAQAQEHCKPVSGAVDEREASK